MAADIVFDGPMTHLVGFEAYMQGLAAFAQAATGKDGRIQSDELTFDSYPIRQGRAAQAASAAAPA